nr:AbgT family transporter [Brevibacterium gallinarum]
MSTSAQAPEKPGIGQRFLDTVERIGNKLPEPFTLFLGLFVITGIISTFMALSGVKVSLPGSDEEVVIKGLFTGEGMAWFTANIGANYVGFPPLATVLPLLLAVGVAEKTGMLAALVRITFGSAPRWMLPYAVAFVGVSFSVMGDSAFIIIPRWPPSSSKPPAVTRSPACSAASPPPAPATRPPSSRPHSTRCSPASPPR